MVLFLFLLIKAYFWTPRGILHFTTSNNVSALLEVVIWGHTKFQGLSSAGKEENGAV